MLNVVGVSTCDTLSVSVDYISKAKKLFVFIKSAHSRIQSLLVFEILLYQFQSLH